MTRSRFLLFVAVMAGIFAVSYGSRAASPVPAIMSAPDVRKLQLEGRILLVDIRSPEEWRKTGVAAGALTVTVHRRDFASALLAAAGGNYDRPIAIICATGGRTALARRYLGLMGFTTVVDLSEGMLGNSRGPGWIRRGLPVVAYHGE